ncbi:hypothetical protein [Halocola ammonii]
MKKPKRTTLLISLLGAYSLIMTGLFIRQYWIHERQSFDKNYKHSWNLDGTVLSMRNKETNKLNTVYYDENFDYNYERAEYYADDHLVAKAFDYDENGVFEKITYFDLNSEYIGFDQDIDSDQIYEYSLMIMENNDSLYLFDTNNNFRIDSLSFLESDR